MPFRNYGVAQAYGVYNTVAKKNDQYNSITLHLLILCYRLYRVFKNYFIFDLIPSYILILKSKLSKLRTRLGL